MLFSTFRFALSVHIKVHVVHCLPFLHQLIGDDYNRGEVYLSEEEDSRWKRKFYSELQKV